MEQKICVKDCPKRYTVILETGRSAKLYGDPDKIAKLFPEAVEIVECHDETFKTYVEQIRQSSSNVFLDYRGREVWEIPHGNGHILYRQFVDDSGEYLDGCDYQRWDNIGTLIPCLKTLSTPEEFYNDFLHQSTETRIRSELVSLETLKQSKAKVIYNKNGLKFWKDDNGLLYGARKQWLPTKADRAEYSKFHDNKEAALISYGTEVAFRKTQWFESMEEFAQFFAPIKRENSSMCYEVRRAGYRKLPPEQRRLIIAFPSFDLRGEIALAKQDTANKTAVAKKVLNAWIGKAEQGTRELAEALIHVYLEE